MARKKKTDHDDMPCPFCGDHEVGDSKASKNLVKCAGCGNWSTRDPSEPMPEREDETTTDIEKDGE